MGAINSYQYGDKVKDKVTDYCGVVTAKRKHHGKAPVQYLVECVDGIGRPVKQWINAKRLDLVQEPDYDPEYLRQQQREKWLGK